MKIRSLFLTIFLVAGSYLSFSQPVDYKGFPEWSWHKQDTTEYYLYTPRDMKEGERYPIALFLHGCCGQSYTATLRNCVDPPARMWHNFGENTQQIPTYIISAATSRGWSQHIDNLKAAIDDLVENHQGDPTRIYISGFSMGGRGTWEFIQKYPDYFAAAMPMGMDFRGDHQAVKSIPIWTNRGTEGWYTQRLRSDVAIIRYINGDIRGGGESWVTGVNPRLTEFEGIGHGVQWIATSTQDLPAWAYTKINDGNAYPNVFFNNPSGSFRPYRKGTSIPVEIIANDNDGTISKVECYINDKLVKTFSSAPYMDSILLEDGDNRLKAIAYDDKGKTNTATIIVKTDISPEFIDKELPTGNAGSFYEKQIQVTGNMPVRFSAEEAELPEGIMLSERGLLKGIPTVPGSYPIKINVRDSDGDKDSINFRIEVKEKQNDGVIVKNIVSSTGTKNMALKLRLKETPEGDTDGEINFSEVGPYEGLTFIQTNRADKDNADKEFLSFEVDEDVTVYVAYEKLDLNHTSSIPAWLKDFKKDEENEIVAQYYYYGVYSKDFKKGKITLPGPDAKNNNVHSSYFVMVKKKGKG